MAGIPASGKSHFVEGVDDLVVGNSDDAPKLSEPLFDGYAFSARIADRNLHIIPVSILYGPRVCKSDVGPESLQASPRHQGPNHGQAEKCG